MGEDSTRIHLIRHGAVAAEWRERIYGRLDVPLAPEGENEARRAVARLAGVRLDAVVSSGLQRAEFTAALLRAERPGLARVDDPRLLEIDRGRWAGLDQAALDARHPGSHAAWRASSGLLAAPGGETVQDVSNRVLPALDELARRHPGGAVAVVAHLWVVRAALCSAHGVPLQRCTELVVATGATHTADWPCAGVSVRTR